MGARRAPRITAAPRTALATALTGNNTEGTDAFRSPEALLAAAEGFRMHNGAACAPREVREPIARSFLKPRAA
eukprot:7317890-Alexandrium_andersonii.AAC.1